MVSVSIIAMIVAIMIPSVRSLRKSYESTGAQSMINSALASARAIAAKEHKYAGIRFQCEYKDDTYPADAAQYMIFVVSDYKATDLANGFRAADGIKPIRLPEQLMVLEADSNDSKYVDFYNDPPAGIKTRNSLTSFTVVFSPVGKLMIHDVRVRNRNGKANPATTDTSAFGSDDSVFNSIVNIRDNRTGMFVQDDYTTEGFEEETSVNKFVICERDKFKNTDKNNRWSDYLSTIKTSYINGYTGELIEY